MLTAVDHVQLAAPPEAENVTVGPRRRPIRGCG